MNGKTVRRLLVGTIGLTVAAGAVGCTKVQAADQKIPAGGTTTTAAPAVVTSAGEQGTDGTDPQGDSGTAGVRTSNRTSTTTHRGTTTTKATTTTAPAGAGAKVVSFTVVRKPSCPVQASPGAPFSSPGSPVVIAWQVSGASGAAISVDSPGMYGSYGSDYAASGQLELAFPCDTTPGKTTHTYTVWPKGAKSVSQNLTVSATNNTP
ncbi:hypothetical protein [Actinokineospora enzanensis]|uniref:hypothetical protein n=1 Tax=Actinokineospora enzanensis TaxID=155975 RepID=UPI000369302F|nr:hypothetical protein [Actinokineospora enzanensis]